MTTGPRATAPSGFKKKFQKREKGRKKRRIGGTGGVLEKGGKKTRSKRRETGGRPTLTFEGSRALGGVQHPGGDPKKTNGGRDENKLVAPPIKKKLWKKKQKKGNSHKWATKT